MQPIYGHPKWLCLFVKDLFWVDSKGQLRGNPRIWGDPPKKDAPQEEANTSTREFRGIGLAAVRHAASLPSVRGRELAAPGAHQERDAARRALNRTCRGGLLTSSGPLIVWSQRCIRFTRLRSIVSSQLVGEQVSKRSIMLTPDSSTRCSLPGPTPQ